MTEQEIIEGTATEVVAYEPPAPPATLFRTEDPREVVVKATETAKPLAEVIKKQKLYKKIGDKNHVLVEGWTLLGSMLGVVPVCVWTRQLENGWEARVEARTLDGRVVGAAEAMCLRSEALWKGRDEYAIRSMAQTRATSKALRQPLGFVIQLAGFAPEPVEEVEDTASSKRAGEPSGSDRRTPAAGESRPEGKTPASPAPSESPFKAPTGPRGGRAAQLEANELAEKLRELVELLGATDSLPMVERKREAADIPWLKRQIATAEKALARRKEEE